MTSLRVLGIDPGVSGGWALAGIQDGKTSLLAVSPMPTYTHRLSRGKRTYIDTVQLAEDLRRLEISVACIEVVASRPRQAGQFSFGFNTGLVHGVLHTLGVRIHDVAPQTWKAAYNLRREETEQKGDVKNRAREIAAAIFPDHARAFAKVKDDGVAEAALIALYGLEQHL